MTRNSGAYLLLCFVCLGASRQEAQARLSDLDQQGGPFIPVDPSYGGSESLSPFLYRHPRRLDPSLFRQEALPLGALLASYRLSSGFGIRKDPFTRRFTKHQGLDLAAPKRSRIRVMAAGTVIFAGRKGSLGRCVEIDHGNGIVTRYGHLSSIGVKKGQSVKKDQIIGRTGSSGRARGPHLHFETWVNGKAVDPRLFIEAKLIDISLLLTGHPPASYVNVNQNGNKQSR